jgi:uncharacterized membrane protein YbhN (UPF0104 family)
MNVPARAAQAVIKIYQPLVILLAAGGIVIMLWKERASVAVLRDVYFGDWIVIALLMATNVVLFGVRAKHVMDKLGRFRLRPLWWQRVFVNSFALNSVMPQAGALYRAYELKTVYDLNVLEYVRAYYFIAWLGVLLILAFSSSLMAALSLSPLIQGWNVLQISLLACVGLACAPVAAFYAIPRLFPESKRFGRVRAALQDTFAFTAECIRDAQFIAVFALLSAAAFVIDVGVLILSIEALHFRVPFEVAVLMYVLSSVFGLIRITPGNIGVQEFVFGVVALQSGFSVVDGVVLSIFMRLVRVIAVVVLLAAVNTAYGVLRLKRAV